MELLAIVRPADAGEDSEGELLVDAVVSNQLRSQLRLSRRPSRGSA
jgi:hypothetical protein